MPRAPFVILVEPLAGADYRFGLSGAERQQLAAMRHPGTADRSAFGWWLRCTVLSALLERPANGLKFSTGEHGRPELVGAGVSFNLSHAGSRFALAVAEAPIGVDVETCRRERDWSALADHVLDEHERRRVRATGQTLPRAVIRHWTLKEAWLKGLGLGLGGGLKATAFRFGGGRIRGRRPELSADHGWRFGQQWIDADTSLAWALRDGSRRRVRVVGGRIGGSAAAPMLQLP